ncbi:MAG: hypothetical protein D3910_10535 [Candidatus Electrothrix sp. ATG2]|nr:hypothetical protein [Candidatus Electrothrix sp. ATG2]
MAQIGTDVKKEDIESGKAVSIFENVLCIKAEGNILLEDYERIARIADEHEGISKFVNCSIEANILNSPEFKDFSDKIALEKKEIINMKNTSAKKRRKGELKKAEDALQDLINSKLVAKVDDWIIDGIKSWVRVLLPDVFNVRLYPFADLANFHVMSNVKREFFLDGNTESLHYLFGAKPTIKATMLGVVTSVPQKDENIFKPMEEFSELDRDENKDNNLLFEKAFRGMFRGFDGLEELIRTCRYPRIMVQPIAIYRAVKSNEALQRQSTD